MRWSPGELSTKSAQAPEKFAVRRPKYSIGSSPKQIILNTANQINVTSTILSFFAIVNLQ